MILRFAPGETLAFTPEQAEMVAQDHLNCLCRLRSCEVEESVVLDRIDGQVTLAKLVIEADRNPTDNPERAWESFAGLAERVRNTVDGAFGVRRGILNRAVSEVDCESVDVEGQRPIGLLDETTRLGYIECWFDHRRWGEEALTPIVAEVALRDPAFVDATSSESTSWRPLAKD